jgi:dTDP-4-amino-4,6-dideoxygalactose transaminase
MSSPFQVVKDFESAIAEYCGAPYAVSCTSCTMGLLLTLAFIKSRLRQQYTITLPCRTYVGVAASVKNAGFDLAFEDFIWSGEYMLHPFPVWDSARRTTSGMYRKGQFQVLSLHWSKILGVQQGGVVLHDDPIADIWLRKARFDGRSEGVDPLNDEIQYPSWHAYMSPEIAAEALMRLSILPKHNADLPNSNYPDLSLQKAFQ